MAVKDGNSRYLNSPAIMQSPRHGPSGNRHTHDFRVNSHCYSELAALRGRVMPVNAVNPHESVAEINGDKLKHWYSPPSRIRVHASQQAMPWLH